MRNRTCRKWHPNCEARWSPTIVVTYGRYQIQWGLTKTKQRNSVSWTNGRLREVVVYEGSSHCRNVWLLRNLSKDDVDDGNVDATKQQVLISSTVALHVRFTFSYISLPFSAKRREMTKFNVLWRLNVSTRRWIFLSLSELNAVSTKWSPG